MLKTTAQNHIAVPQHRTAISKHTIITKTTTAVPTAQPNGTALKPPS
ncbi:MAG: hypothetical protein IJO54_07435 [Oscillospiraceae bacterium]|nr:hypothetical protein [Oscillospiraceae bacterium]